MISLGSTSGHSRILWELPARPQHRPAPPVSQARLGQPCAGSGVAGSSPPRPALPRWRRGRYRSCEVGARPGRPRLLHPPGPAPAPQPAGCSDPPATSAASTARSSTPGGRGRAGGAAGPTATSDTPRLPRRRAEPPEPRATPAWGSSSDTAQVRPCPARPRYPLTFPLTFPWPRLFPSLPPPARSCFRPPPRVFSPRRGQHRAWPPPLLPARPSGPGSASGCPEPPSAAGSPPQPLRSAGTPGALSVSPGGARPSLALCLRVPSPTRPWAVTSPLVQGRKV